MPRPAWTRSWRRAIPGPGHGHSAWGGLIALRTGALDRAEAAFADARVAALQAGHAGTATLWVYNDGVIAAAHGDGAKARRCFEQALDQQVAWGDRWGRMHARAALAQVSLDQVRPGEVLEALEETSAAFRREGATLQLARAQANLGAAQPMLELDATDALQEASQLAGPDYHPCRLLVGDPRPAPPDTSNSGLDEARVARVVALTPAPGAARRIHPGSASRETSMGLADRPSHLRRGSFPPERGRQGPCRASPTTADGSWT